MVYLKRIVCLANSFKTGGFCIAGRELTPTGGLGSWVRPVSSRPASELSRAEATCTHGMTPRLLDILDIVCSRPVPHGHQTENHLIDPKVPWVRQGQFPFAHIAAFVERPSSLWTNSERTSTGWLNCISPSEAARHANSLYLIEPRHFVLETQEKGNGHLSYRGSLPLHTVTYKLNITDPCISRRFSHYPAGEQDLTSFNPIYLTVSLTEPYDLDGRCHKLIAAVITNPPQ